MIRYNYIGTITIYFVVREGDLSDSTLFYTVPEGMRENKVYIVNYYHEDIDTIRVNTLKCIDRLKVAMKNKKK
jgi:hypothetical protein